MGLSPGAGLLLSVLMSLAGVYVVVIAEAATTRLFGVVLIAVGALFVGLNRMLLRRRR